MMKNKKLPKIKNLLPFFYGLGLVLFFFIFTIVGFDLSYFPGDLGDGRFNNYILEHAHLFFTGNIASFWDAPFMYPEPKIITYSDNLLGSAPFYSVFRMVGLDRETAYQIWFIFVFALNYSCCYFFFNWQFKNKYAAVLGALVFSCSMAIQSQITHAQTFPRFPIPLAFWMAMLFHKNLNPGYFFGTIFFVVYQFYCAIYLGFFLLVPISILLLLILLHKKEKLKEQIKDMRWIGLCIGGIFLNMGIFLPLILPYIERANSGGMNTYAGIIDTIPTIRSFFYSQPGSLFWSKLSAVADDYPAFWDHQLFVGGVAMVSMLLFSVIVVVKLFKNKKWKKVKVGSTTILLFLTTVVTFILFTRYQGFSFYKLLFNLPGFAAMRSLTRIINVELIFFAFATAYITNWLFNAYKKWAPLLFIFLAGLLVADNYYKEGTSYRTKKRIAQERVEQLMHKMQHIPKGSIVSYEPEFEGASYPYQIDAMLAGQSLGLKMINGYSGTSPYGYDLCWREMNEEGRLKWLSLNPHVSDSVYVVH